MITIEDIRSRAGLKLISHPAGKDVWEINPPIPVVTTCLCPSYFSCNERFHLGKVVDDDGQGEIKFILSGHFDFTIFSASFFRFDE